MDWFSKTSLTALAASINNRFTKVLSAVTQTFGEVQDNIESVDAKTYSLTYDSTSETLTFTKSSSTNSN